MKLIGIFGGTFDPPHHGHIRLAEQALERLSLDEVQFLPCANPVHRTQPMASASDRLQMLELAIGNLPGLTINNIELDRGGPSYMIESLRQIRADNKNSTLCLMLGVDAFNTFPNWKSPDEILKLANLVVCRRPGIALDDSIYSAHHFSSLTVLQSDQCGCILPLDIEENPCSSTLVRAWLAKNEFAGNCLAPTVIDYIYKHHLYET